MKRNRLLEEAKMVLEVEAGAILALIPRLDDGFLEALKMIDCCRGRLIVTGMGKSGLVGKKIAATFSSIGAPSLFLHPAEAIHGDLGMVTEGDVILAISNSGETEELITILPHLKLRGVPLAIMSGNPKSTLGRQADAFIDVSVKREACPLGIVPTASSTAALAMGDALAVALIRKRGFKERDFACLHPGGSLGKRLLVTVKDLMVSGQDVPCVTIGTPMSETIVEISSKRLGMALVLGSTGVVKGVITDGDLRRGIERYGKDLLDMKAGGLMSKHPKSVKAGELAARALALMEAHSITSLAVLGPGGMAEGVIQIHHIMKKGIA